MLGSSAFEGTRNLGFRWKKMSDIIVDYGSLPDDIREKLAELELELSEGKPE